jgi:hypothetical protein
VITYLIPVITLIIGSGVGVLTTVVAARMKHEQDLNIKLLEYYLKIRTEIVDTISNLCDRSLVISMSDEERSKYREKLAIMYYKYYDLLPRQALNSILLLHVSLSFLTGSLYKVRGKVILPMEKDEVYKFIEICCDFKNSRYMAVLDLNGKDVIVASNQSIVLHARYVFKSINAYSASSHLQNNFRAPQILRINKFSWSAMLKRAALRL